MSSQYFIVLTLARRGTALSHFDYVSRHVICLGT